MSKEPRSRGQGFFLLESTKRNPNVWCFQEHKASSSQIFPLMNYAGLKNHKKERERETKAPRGNQEEDGTIWGQPVLEHVVLISRSVQV